VAAAAACALAVGLPLESVAAGVLALASVPGRVERVDRGQPFAVIVDFAHTEQALANLLGWVSGLTRNRVHVVFGCGGERDRGKRPAMGRVAATSGAEVYVTSDNPRGEDPRAIVEEVLSGVRDVEGAGSRCRAIVDRREAIETAIAAARPGDAVVIAGRGHETTQDLGSLVVAFDDRAVAREILEKMGFTPRRRGA
jgi:UDP-N-acetylmuramoyl-L-alanyl-D-glutamate--2,6-diaminopimelate ligase